MARPSDRMRLKDKIVDDVSKAIKSIQEQAYYLFKDPAFASSAEKGNLTLSNGDRQSHKLCDKLDHAFLHGLKDVTHGYWKLFKLLSHKGMIREIDLLTNVTTDLGKGRAWLYISLNEGLLESYIRLLSENEKLVKKHYSKEALVLDGDRMHVLLTLTSGLDFVTFQLDYDLPYLDLSPSPPRTQSGFGEDYVKDGFHKKPVSPISLPSDSDTASICSYDVQSPGLANRTVSFTSSTGEPAVPSNNGDAKGAGVMCHSNTGFNATRALTPTEALLLSGNTKWRPASDAQSITSTGSDLDRHQRFENIIAVNKDNIEEEDDSLEVIRIKSKTKKKKKTKSSESSGTTVNKVNSKPTRSLSSTSDIAASMKKNESANSSTLSLSSKNESEASDSLSCEHLQKVEDNSSLKGAVIPQLDSGIDICDITSAVSESNESDKKSVCSSMKENTGEIRDEGSSTMCDKTETVSTESSHIVQESRSSMSVIESKIAAMCGDSNSQEGTMSPLSSSSQQHHDLFDSYGNADCPDSPQSHTDKNTNDFLGGCNSRPVSQVGEQDKSRYKNNCGVLNEEQGEEEDIFSTKKTIRSTSPVLPEEEEKEDIYDVYSTKKSPSLGDSRNLKKRDESQSSLTKLQEASHLQDYMDCVLTSQDSTTEEGSTTGHQDSSTQDFSLNLDNNTKLQVMLEIFKQEDETFVKMFASRENHTEGHFAVAFVLISDQYLYLLHYQQHSRKFMVQSVTKLTDIIFISTGLYDQTLNIESRDKSRLKQRLWLTPGHQDLTKAIVQSLTDVVKEANAGIVSVRSRFSVGSDVPLQKIGLRKYISKEMHCETQDVLISDYSLVFWEDPSSSKSSYSDSKTKEGTLLLRVQDPVKGFIWKPVYLVLQGSMLSVSNSKSDPRPHSHLGLGGDQCIGCRLTEVGERQHCLELVLAQGVSWCLSAATESEILDWRRSLCLAVSQGTEESGVLSGCTSCCCIQASNQLFLCHEDLDTKFFRTLGRAQMEDVTGVLVDKDEPTYCIVEFESQEVGVSSVRWVFHLASAADTKRFTSSLADCWKEIFQVDLPLSVLDDVTLQRHCQSYAMQLRKPFELR